MKQINNDDYISLISIGMPFGYMIKIFLDTYFLIGSSPQ